MSVSSRSANRLRRLRAAISALGSDRSGAILVWVGVSLPVITGLGGLGLDVATWYVERRVMQAAVDAAALAATHTLAAGGDQAAVETAVSESLSQNDFTLAASDSLQVNNPPQSGPNAGRTDAVEVSLARPADLYLSSVLLSDGVTIQTRAVGGIIIVGTHCVLALDETMDSALEFSGTANADINCGVASNSSSSQAIHVSGTAELTADPAQAYGDILVENNADLVTEHPPQPYSPRVPDPFGPDGRNITMPTTPTACSPLPTFGSGTTQISPGRYCADLLIENKDVVFQPGEYIFDGADLRIKAGSLATGDGVTFFFTASTPENVGVVEFTSNSTVDLTAPSTGPYAGMLIYMDPAASSYSGTSLVQNLVLGGASTNLNGVIYAPSREIVFAGGSSAAGECLHLIGRKVTITGNTVIHNDPSACAAMGLDNILQVRARLIE